MFETRSQGRRRRGITWTFLSGARFGLCVFVMAASSGCQPMEIVHPSAVGDRLVFENCESRRKCGVAWEKKFYSVHIRDGENPIDEVWWFKPKAHDYPIVYGEAPSDRVSSAQHGGVPELEVGASYQVGDCVFRYLGNTVELLTPRTCGQPRKRAGRTTDG